MSKMENNRDKASKSNSDRVIQDQAIQNTMSSIQHKFLFMSSKGGGGKTSVIVNLAVALSKRGLKVGLMDANFHGPDMNKKLGLDPARTSYSDKPIIPAAYSDNLKVAFIESVMEDQDEAGVWGKSPEISDILWFISSLSWGNLDYLFIDTPPGPGEGLLTMIRAIPEAKTIIVTAPNKIGRDRAKNMINFLRKEKIQISGWIENMQGFLCQHCGLRQELFSSGGGSRAVFLGDIPFLGRIPIDPHMDECIDVRKPSLEMYPESEVAEGCKLIVKKILGGINAFLPESGSIYHDI
jgi:Mrp family chromosome partitioning ATPase